MSETIDTGNYQLVGVTGDDVIVMMPKARMTRAQALLHAAWLVAIADEHNDFARVLRAVQST